MRVIITGQVGVEKGSYLRELSNLARENNKPLKIFNVGNMMYEEAPDVPAGRILNLPISRLNTLRRAVFKEILREVDSHENVVVNTHATFRWRHGLFSAFDYDQLKSLIGDLYITLVDNVESVHKRLVNDHELDHTLKDILVWREEEMLATEIIATITRGYGHYHMLARGRAKSTAMTLYRMMYEPKRKKAYLSFPMSHVMDLPGTLAEIERFKEEIGKHFICFDPSDVDEMGIYQAAEEAKRGNQERITVPAAGETVTLATDDVLAVGKDILGQIYARDFKMVDQSDLILSFIPELPSGKPGLSSGVERELHHAFEGGKEVYVVWACKATPSPFITETATRMFPSTQIALEYFRQKGYF
jgi:adenylate kinase